MPRLTTTLLGSVAAVALVFGVAAPAQAVALPKYPLSISLASSDSPKVGDTVKFTGTTSKKLKGETVNLDRKIGSGKWAKAATAKVSAKGTLAAKIRAASAGTVNYRFSLPKTKRHQGATSSSATTTAYAYYYLSDLTPVDSSYLVTQGSTTMAGKPFLHSVLMPLFAYGDTDTTNYNMSYKCKAFETTLGLDDTSNSTAIAHDEIYADGAKLGEADATIGKLTPVQYDVSGVFRLKLAMTTANYTSVDATAGWGNARVLCAGKP